MHKSGERSRDQAGAVRIRRGVDRAQIKLCSESSSLSVAIGPGYSARVTRSDANSLREISVAPGRLSCAYVLVDLLVEGRTLDCTVSSVFVSGTRRVDRFRVDHGKIMRTARWTFSGEVLEADYTDTGRTLRLRRGGQEVSRMLTVGTLVPAGWSSRTQFEEGAVPAAGFISVRGSAKLGSSMSLFNPYNPAPGVEGHFTLDTSHDGSVSQGAISSDTGKDGVVVSSRSWTNLDVATGEWTNTQQTVTSQPGGQTSVQTTTTTQNVADDSPGAGSSTWSPGSKTTTTGTAETDGKGGFSTYTETSGPSSWEGQRSAYTNDGQGNESQTTVTNHEDGSFTIETTSKDADGNRTTSSETYDKSGNPQSGSGSSDGQKGGDPQPGGGGSGGGELPADDGSDPNPRPNTIGAGDGELPADDGTDPCPEPNMLGPKARSFYDWLAELTPFLGGGSYKPTIHPGDPINRIAEATGDEEDGVGGHSQTGGGPGFDLRPLLRVDPENNPKAMLTALTRFAGIAAVGPGAAAAMQAIRHMER